MRVAALFLLLIFPALSADQIKPKQTFGPKISCAHNPPLVLQSVKPAVPSLEGIPEATLIQQDDECTIIIEMVIVTHEQGGPDKLITLKRTPGRILREISVLMQRTGWELDATSVTVQSSSAATNGASHTYVTLTATFVH